MVDKIPGDVGPPRSPNEKESFGPLLLREFDENPGERAVDKCLQFGKKGAIIGLLAGGTYAGIFEPAANVNGLTYALRHMGTAAIITGTSGAVLGAAIPIAQAIRKKNDPVAWMWGGFAAGSVFGLKSANIPLSLRVGALFAVVLGITKATEGYKEPYVDFYKYLREPKPKYHKLIDENGNAITNARL